jgi:hypothetical protein
MNSVSEFTMSYKNKNLGGISIPIETQNQLRLKVVDVIGNNNLSSDKLIFLITNLMAVMRNNKDIGGKQKKEMIIYFINGMIDKSNLDLMEKTNLRFLMSNVVPGAIDVLIDVATKKYILKNAKSCFKFLMNCVCN